MAVKAIQNPSVAELLKNRLRDHPRTRRTGELLSDLLYPTTTTILSSRLVPFSNALLTRVGSFKAATDFILDTPYAQLEKQLSDQRLETQTLEREISLLKEECQDLRKLLEDSQNAPSVPDPHVEEQMKELRDRASQFEDLLKDIQAQLERANEENGQLKSSLQLTNTTTSDPETSQTLPQDAAGSWVQVGMLTPKSLITPELSSPSLTNATTNDTHPNTVPEEPTEGESEPSAPSPTNETNDEPAKETVEGYDAGVVSLNDETPRVEDDQKQLDAPTVDSKPIEGHDVVRMDSSAGSDPVEGSQGSGSMRKKKHFDLHLVQDFFSGKNENDHNLLHKRRRVFSTPSAPELSEDANAEKRKKKGSTGPDMSGSATLSKRHSRFESFVIEPLERRASSVVKRGKELLRQDSSASITRERRDSDPAPVQPTPPRAL